MPRIVVPGIAAAWCVAALAFAVAGCDAESVLRDFPEPRIELVRPGAVEFARRDGKSAARGGQAAIAAVVARTTPACAMRDHA
jgi:hypothetical protein